MGCKHGGSVLTLRALGLLSGGLDSMIASAMLARLGARVEGVHFKTGFGREAYEISAGRLAERAEWSAIHLVDATQEFFEQVLIKPKFGYGSAMNPCLDCRIFMLRRADRLARRRGIDLLFTGEVVGQRSMGQSRGALQSIEREAGVDGRLLRPLCAALMPPTIAEQRGSVDRGALGRIHGSSRRRQFALARELGLEGYPTPAAGCCCLADTDFAGRLRDELSHRQGKFLTEEEIALLKRGRHFRLSWNLKAILGRDLEESSWLAEHAEGRCSVQVADGHGSYGLLLGEPDASSRRAAASLAARYSRHRQSAAVQVLLRDGGEELLDISPATDELVERWRL
jgi:tRNA-specific 2-thiouridylase